MKRPRPADVTPGGAIGYNNFYLFVYRPTIMAISNKDREA